MAHVAPVGNSSIRKTLAPDTYQARCYQMIQLGTQEEEVMGTKKTLFKIWLGWEFPTELDVFFEDKGEQPYTMGRELTFSMHEKASFRLLLESWRNKKFTDEEARTFDAGKLLGAVCQISVQEYIKKSGEKGVKIGAVIPVAKGTVVPPAINPIQDLSLDESFDTNLFNSLPKFLKERIEKSPEYQKIVNPEPVYQAPATNQQLVDGLFNGEVDEENPPF